MFDDVGILKTFDHDYLDRGLPYLMDRKLNVVVTNIRHGFNNTLLFIRITIYSTFLSWSLVLLIVFVYFVAAVLFSL